MPPVEKFFFFVGRLCFPKQQDWEQTRSAKTLLFVIGFSVALALIVAKFIRLLYNQPR